MAATNHTRPRTSRGAAHGTRAAGPADGRSPETHPPRPAAAAPLHSPDRHAPPPQAALADALGVLRVIQRSLATRAQADARDEDALLQDVIVRLTDVHQALDLPTTASVEDGSPAASADDPDVLCAAAAGVSAADVWCAALRRGLREIDRRLEVAYATAVTAERALVGQNAEHDADIALSLRWSVCDALVQQQLRLRGLADGIPEDRSPAAGAAHGTPAAGTTASSSSTDDALSSDSATTSGEIDQEAAVRDGAVRRTP